MESFDDALVQAVDEGLLSFGEPIKKIIYFHLKNKFSIEREDIPKDPEQFISAIKSLLGIGGASISILILKILCNRYGINYDLLSHRDFSGDLQEIKGKIGKRILKP